MKNINYILAVLMACGVSLSSLAAVTATVDKGSYASGDSIRLLLKRDGNADSPPDLAPLKKDFDLIGSGSGSSVQIINGHMTSRAEVNVLLSPKHDGKIQIPPLTWGGEQSQAIDLTIGGGQQGAQAANDNTHVFMTATPDQQQPYVQAAVVLTVRLYSDQSLYQASLDLPASSDVLVKPFGKDANSSETRNGRTYQVIERKYLLFPQKSGRLSFNGPVLDAEVADTGGDPFDNMLRPFGGVMNSTKPLRLHAKPIELNVMPRPQGTANWLPAQKVTLEETWNQATIHAGEPLTRQLHIAALGLTGEQLPDPSTLLSLPEGIKAYPDQANVADNPQRNTVLGSREQNIALIASRPGHYELPEVKLAWWDTVHNAKREITLPAHTLDVLPAVAGATPAPQISLNQRAQAGPMEQARPMEQTSLANTWMWISFAFALLWLATTAIWWRARRRVQPAVTVEKPPEAISANSEFKAFKLSCRANDPHAARRHLLAWAGTVWPADAPQGLNELSRRIDDAKAAEALRQLDRACYTGSGWQGDVLAQSLHEVPVQPIPAGNRHVLPDLYS